MGRPTAIRCIVILAVAGGGCKLEERSDMMAERKGIYSFKGTPLTLIGPALKAGDRAPDAKLVANDWSEVSLSSYRGKVVILSVVQSLDTSVCDTQTRRFNEQAAALGPDAIVVTVSMDLPPAQKRWCGASGLKNVVTLSDHKEGALGRAYGVLVKELRLDGRSVFVVDRQGMIRYIQILSEGTHEPDYAPALEAAKKLL
jgi:thiol peroxidase